MSRNLAVCVKDVKKQHGSLQLLKGIDLEVEKGTIYGLLGPSGCGKTTLLSILVGRKKFDQGDIHVLGNIVNEQKSSVLGARVGYMPQELALVESLTVEDTLFYFGRIYGMTDKLIGERYHDLHSLLELPPSERREMSIDIHFFGSHPPGNEKALYSFNICSRGKLVYLIHNCNIKKMQN